jgi:group I intron endonuclease
MTTGIYKIRNIVNDKSYVGFSTEIEKRWRQHKADLRNDHHINILIQNAWNKYGEHAFEFIIVEETSELADREVYWIHELDTHYNGYNLTEGGDDPPNHTGFKRSAKTRKLMGDVQRGRKKTQDHKDKIAKTLTGHTRSDESRRRQGVSIKGTNNHAYRSDISDHHLFSLREQGMSWRAIGKEVGMSHVGVKNRILKFRKLVGEAMVLRSSKPDAPERIVVEVPND